jgi:filamentous hemagglutinin
LTNPLIRQAAAQYGTWFTLRNGVHLLQQAEGDPNGTVGVFEWILDAKGKITHERFIENGAMTGSPNQHP